MIILSDVSAGRSQVTNSYQTWVGATDFIAYKYVVILSDVTAGRSQVTKSYQTWIGASDFFTYR